MNEFASANLTMGQINALVKTLGGEKEVLHLLRRSDWVIRTKTPDIFRTSCVLTVNGVQCLLVLYSLAELGFKDGATWEEIFFRANELGLKPCLKDTVESLASSVRENEIQPIFCPQNFEPRMQSGSTGQPDFMGYWIQHIRGKGRWSSYSVRTGSKEKIDPPFIGFLRAILS